MFQKQLKLLFFVSLVFPVFLNSCSSSNGYSEDKINYIISRINSTTKKTITLNDGTIWGFNHFSINTPGEEIIITFYESSLGGIAYLNGIEQSVDFLGTVYGERGSTNNIIKKHEGLLTYISEIDSLGRTITLLDSSQWLVHPEQREFVKKWQKNERVILDSKENFIINPKIYEISYVKRIGTENEKH